MLKLDETKIIKKLFVIKEIRSWLQIFHSSNQEGKCPTHKNEQHYFTKCTASLPGMRRQT